MQSQRESIENESHIDLLAKSGPRAKMMNDLTKPMDESKFRSQIVDVKKEPTVAALIKALQFKKEAPAVKKLDSSRKMDSSRSREQPDPKPKLKGGASTKTWTKKYQ